MPIAPSAYYAARTTPVTAAEFADAHAANAVLDCWRANRGVYGVRKLWHALRRDGHQLGRDQLARLIGIAGVSGACRGRRSTRTTTPAASAPRHPDLVQRGWNTPTRPDQWWAANFTYVWTLAGFVYVAFLSDVFSRRILGWRVTTTQLERRLSELLGEHAWRASGLGAPHDLEQLEQRIVVLEQQAVDLRLQLEERDRELTAARDANREMMTRLNSARPG